MSDYKRYFVAGGTYFFTVVTDCRIPLFADPIARPLLGSVFRRCIYRMPVRVVAIVLLPDHLHCLWSLPPGDSAYSDRWKWLKGEFARQWLALGGREVPHGNPRQRRRGVWQRRFWEHTIRDESDLEHHADYIHYNPVHHGLAASPCEWPWSSFHRFVRAGHYSADWGRTAPRELMHDAGE
jgi:putative transposase